MLPNNSLNERRAHTDRRSGTRRAIETATRLPTRRGDVLVLRTAQSFTVHVVGAVSVDGQQDFHGRTNVTYVIDRAAAIAAAEVLVESGRVIFFRDIDTGQWSEVPS